MYSQYISNFDNALKVLEESCKKNVLFNDLVKEFEVCVCVCVYVLCQQLGGWGSRGSLQ